VNGKVEAGREEPVGNIRRKSREQMVLSEEIGSRVADMHKAYNNERKMTWKE